MYTAEQLIEILARQPKNAVVVLSENAEGDMWYSPLDGLDAHMSKDRLLSVNGSTYDNEQIREIEDGTPVIALYPSPR
jgi:hypothetical protein